MTMPIDAYENALRAAREVWEPDSPDFARRDVLDRLLEAWNPEIDREVSKKLEHGLTLGMGWIKARDLIL